MATNENSIPQQLVRLRVPTSKKLLPILGLVIVFVTFIVKDGLREHVKDLKDSIESAQTLNLLRTDSQQIQGTAELANANILNVGSQFRAISEHQPDPYKPHKAGLSDMEMQVAFAMTAFHRLQGTFETTKELSAEFPVVAQQTTDLNNEGADLEKLNTQLQSMNDTVSHLADVRAGVVDDSSTSHGSDELETVIQTSLGVQTKLQTLTTQVAQTSANVLTSAKDYQKKVSLQYTRYTWASWGLYGLGALLTLIGKLSGNDIEAI